MKFRHFIFFILLFIVEIQPCHSQNPELTLQTGHSSEISTFAFSYDGKYLASAGKDNIIIIWDFQLGKQIKILKGHHQSINSIHFLNKGYNIISAGDDGQIIYWDIYTGKVKQILQLQKPVLSFDISDNDSLLIATGLFPEVKCWKIKDSLVVYKSIQVANIINNNNHETEQVNDKNKTKIKPQLVCPIITFGASCNDFFVSRAFYKKGSRLNCLDIRAMSIDEKKKDTLLFRANFINYLKNDSLLFCSTTPSSITIYSVPKKKIILFRPGEFKKLNFISISSNSNDSLIAAVNEDGLIYFWNMSGHFIEPIKNPNSKYTAICFHPFKKEIIVTGNKNGVITILNVENWKVIRELETEMAPLTNLCVNKSGNAIAVTGNNNIITTFNLGSKVSITRFSNPKGKINGIHFISDSTLISAGSDNKICFWDINNSSVKKIKGNRSPKLINGVLNAPLYSLFLNSLTSFFFANKFILGHDESLDVTALSDDNALFATGGKGFNKGIFNQFFIPRIFPIHIIDPIRKKKTAKLKAHYLSINDISINNNHSLIASCGKDYEQGVIDSSFAMLIPIVGQYKIIKAFANKKLMFPIYNSLKIWNTDNNKLFKTFHLPYEVRNLLFSLKNDILVLLDDKENIVILDYKTDSIKKVAYGNGPLLFQPDGKSIYFQGKINSLMQFDLKNNKTIIEFKGHNDSISSAALFPDGKRLATTSLDGSLKVWDVASGKEIVTMYALNSSDFIIKTPDYFYYATKNAKKEIGFTFGIKFYPFEQFDLQYNRPDIVLARLGIASKELIKAYYQAYNKRLKKMGFSEDMFESDFHLPEVTILNVDKLPLNTDNSQFSFSVNAIDSKYNLNRISVWVNNVPLYGVNGVNLRPFQINSTEKEITVDLSQGINKIQISCLNEKGVESLKESFEINYQPQKIRKPNLYIVAIGASEYQNKEWNLTYAAKDANDFSELFNQQKNFYENIYTNKITNQEVTVENIRNIKQKLKLSKVDDVVIIFYAGHGLLDDSLDYYMATYNINFNKPSENGLKYDDLDILLDSIPSRNKILFIDACHSGEVDKESSQELVTENIVEKDIVFRGVKPRGYNTLSNIGYNNSFELMKDMFSDIRKGTGAIVVSSAGGGEFAFEGEIWKNGVFTYSMVNGLNSFMADENNDKKITISELQNHILKKVQFLTNGKQKPTIRQENIDNDFVIWNK